MKVMILSTAARFTGAQVEDLRDRLPVEDVEFSIVLVTRPAEPSLRPRRPVHERATADRTAPARQLSRLERLDRAVTRRLPATFGRNRRVMLATGVTWSPVVREEFARSDLVVALDYNATWAAWQLARRVPGPAVAFQAEGAVASLTQAQG